MQKNVFAVKQNSAKKFFVPKKFSPNKIFFRKKTFIKKLCLKEKIRKKTYHREKKFREKNFSPKFFSKQKNFGFNFDFLYSIAIAGYMCVIIYPELKLALIVRLTPAQLRLVLVKPFYKA